MRNGGAARVPRQSAQTPVPPPALPDPAFSCRHAQESRKELVADVEELKAKISGKSE